MADATIRPLTARSTVLSLLLGAHPARLPAGDLVRVASGFGISAPTLRVALTRMVAAGDLERDDAVYSLSARLLERQRRQDDALGLRARAWRGDWELVVVTASGRAAADRAALRDQLEIARLAERREGVWLRPDNLRRTLPPDVTAVADRFVTRSVADPERLVVSLWPVRDWARSATHLLRRLDRKDTAAGAAAAGARLAAAAAVVRLLLTDPLLPPDLAPPGWPAAELRSAYAAYRDELAALVRSSAAR